MSTEGGDISLGFKSILKKPKSIASEADTEKSSPTIPNDPNPRTPDSRSDDNIGTENGQGVTTAQFEPSHFLSGLVTTPRIKRIRYNNSVISVSEKPDIPSVSQITTPTTLVVKNKLEAAHNLERIAAYNHFFRLRTEGTPGQRLFSSLRSNNSLPYSTEFRDMIQNGKLSGSRSDQKRSSNSGFSSLKDSQNGFKRNGNINEGVSITPITGLRPSVVKHFASQHNNNACGPHVVNISLGAKEEKRKSSHQRPKLRPVSVDVSDLSYGTYASPVETPMKNKSHDHSSRTGNLMSTHSSLKSQRKSSSDIKFQHRASWAANSMQRVPESKSESYSKGSNEAVFNRQMRNYASCREFYQPPYTNHMVPVDMALYRGVFPYITYRKHGGDPMLHALPAPANASYYPFEYPRYQQEMTKTLPSSFQRHHGANNSVSAKQLPHQYFDMYPEEHNAPVFLQGGGAFPHSEIFPAPPIAIANPVPVPTAEEKPRIDLARRQKQRRCLIGWLIGITAGIVVGLALALFVQVSADATDINGLHQGPNARSRQDTRSTEGLPVKGNRAKHPSGLPIITALEITDSDDVIAPPKKPLTTSPARSFMTTTRKMIAIGGDTFLPGHGSVHEVLIDPNDVL